MTPENTLPLLVWLAAGATIAAVISLIVLANVAAKLGMIERALRNLQDDTRTVGGDVRQMSGQLHVLQNVYSDLTAPDSATRKSL